METKQRENWFLDTFGSWGVWMWGIASFLLMILCILVCYRLATGSLAGAVWYGAVGGLWTLSSLCSAVPAGAILGGLRD